MSIIVNLALGLLFGVGLVISGMSDPAKVLNFLDLAGTFDPSLAFVMGGAVLVAAGFFVLTGPGGKRLATGPDKAVVAAQKTAEEQVLAVGRANVSRAISDLARAGLVTRHYAGYATNHRNRGGGRHAVYVVNPGVLKLLRRPAPMYGAVASSAAHQGELFAA